ncbi:MAG: MBL fold metallo-hydrolase [Planctomycetota bacterium]|jgi:metallo-beta-lactamase family protein|nr:MAG: MBL fold metallo-hydrolase [Planctomycetota bacterium]
MPGLTFLGAAGGVSGSRHLVDAAGGRVLIDCGLFQGEKNLRDKNWDRFPVRPDSINAVVLTHGHIDHSGYLPRLAREGFAGPIYTSPATADLLGLLLYDSAKCQAEDALYANRKGFSKHSPALPLYEEQDVDRVLRLVRPHARESWFSPAGGIRCQFHEAGHMLGSSFIEMEAAREQGGSPVRIVFSGDVGRFDAPLYKDPISPPNCDYLVCESTYGDRDHTPSRPLDELEKVTNEAIRRGGMMLVASFAIGRCQQLVYLLRTLMAAGRVPETPIWVDSPMAVGAMEVFRKHRNEHDYSEAKMQGVAESLASPFVRMAKTAEESKAINGHHGAGIVIASSGMMNGGRILHHLARRLPDPKTTVLVAGYQAKGTRGRSLIEGAEFLRIHGRDVPVRAVVRKVDALSGHADRHELDRWLGSMAAPRRTFLVHGEPPAAAALAEFIRSRRGWNVHVPALGEHAELD